jgi:hypothetical protein
MVLSHRFFYALGQHSTSRKFHRELSEKPLLPPGRCADTVKRAYSEGTTVPVVRQNLAPAGFSQVSNRARQPLFSMLRLVAMSMRVFVSA